MHLLCKRDYTFSGTLIIVQNLGRPYTLSCQSCAYRRSLTTLSGCLEVDEVINQVINRFSVRNHYSLIIKMPMITVINPAKESGKRLPRTSLPRLNSKHHPP